MLSLAQVRDSWLVENVALPLAAALVAGALGYWFIIVDRIPPVTFSEGSVTPQHAQLGDTLVNRWRLQRNRDASCTGVISRQIIDSIGSAWRKEDQQIHDFKYPDSEFIARSLQLPFQGPAWGPARYKLSGCYRCDGVSLTKWIPVCFEAPPLTFEITPPRP